MKMEITAKKEETLFNRECFTVNASFEGKTPSRSDIIQKLSVQLKVKPELLVVGMIKQKFGDTSMKFEARLYKDVSSLKNIEHEHNIKKNQPKAKEAEVSA